MRLVAVKRTFQFSKREPSPLIIHLEAELASGETVEFRPLFAVVMSKLREAGKASGGEEMLRLRAYNALQDYVRTGKVERSGQQYRWVAPAVTPTKAPAAGDSASPQA